MAASMREALENPFTPTFGEVPLYMAGRDTVLRSMARAFERQGRAPELTTLVLGARGTGKTALLAKIAEEALGYGWVCANVTAVPGMLDDILVQATRAAERIVGGTSGRRLTGVGVGQLVSVEWEHGPASPSNWRSKMEDVLDSLQQYETGLLITVDEVQCDSDELVQLAAAYQQFVKERRRVGLLMAGLPFHIEELKQNKVVSFLRRAEHQYLGRIADYEMANAIRKTVEGGGRAIGSSALQVAAKAAEGFPFMMQLVGYRAWDEHPNEPEVSLSDIEVGIAMARNEMRERILESTYRGLSDGDIAFLSAMLPDEGDSSLKAIAERMGKSSAYVNTYRRRMLKQGIVGDRRRGEVGFDLPAFKEFLAEKIPDTEA